MIESSLHSSERVTLPEPPPGQQLRSVAGHALLTALMIITPILPVFVPAALFHCGIRNGRRAAWAAAVIALLITGLYVAVVPAGSPELMKMAWSAIAVVALSIVLPSMAALPLVERAEPFGRVLAFLLFGSVIGLLATESASRAALSFSPYDFHVRQALQNKAQVIEFYSANGVPADGLRMLDRWVTYYSTNLLPAVALIVFTLIFTLSLLMLGRLRAWSDHVAKRGDGAAAGAYLFRNFALPEYVLAGFLIGGLTPLTTGLLHKIAANTLLVVAFLYLLQGLAIFRFILVAMGAGVAGTTLGLLLLVLLMFTGVAPFLLAMAGLFDPFFDFRHSKKRKDDSHESHSD